MSFHYLQQCGVTPCKIHIRAVFTSWSPHLASPRQVATRVVQGPLRRREEHLTSVTNHIMETNPLAEPGASQTLFSQPPSRHPNDQPELREQGCKKLCWR